MASVVSSARTAGLAVNPLTMANSSVVRMSFMVSLFLSASLQWTDGRLSLGIGRPVVWSAKLVGCSGNGNRVWQPHFFRALDLSDARGVTHDLNHAEFRRLGVAAAQFKPRFRVW